MERFWNKVDKNGENGCWKWIGGMGSKGYGRFKVKGKYLSPHRFVFELKGIEIPNGMMVCHKCDNPACCNPNHLFFGTQSDNMIDAYKKGRLDKSFEKAKLNQARGERIAQSKLTNQDVVEIRKLYSEGVNGIILAEKFKVHKTNIYRAIKGTQWKHIENNVCKQKN